MCSERVEASALGEIDCYVPRVGPIGSPRGFLYLARKKFRPECMMSLLATVESRIIMSPISVALGLLGVFLYMLRLPGLTRVYERRYLSEGYS